MSWSETVDDVEFLQELVSIPSVSGEEDLLAEHLSWRMSVLGYDVHRDAAGNVVGEIGDSRAEQHIVLLGHIDTVPGLLPVRREGGYLYGRGTVDAKGPLAVFALSGSRVASRWRTTRLTVIGAVSEETESAGAHYLAETMPRPSFAIIGEPSSWQGITVGYKGMLSVVFKMRQPSGHGASGRAVPAEAAVVFWSQLKEHGLAYSNGRRWRFDSLDATLRAVNTWSDGLEQGVEMDIGLRTPPGLDVQALRQHMQEWCGSAELTFPYSEPAYQAQKNTRPVRALLRSIRAEGGRPTFRLKSGTSDMNVVGPVWGCPIVAYGPGDSALDHPPHERLEIGEFLRAVAVLARALDILAGEASST